MADETDKASEQPGEDAESRERDALKDLPPKDIEAEAVKGGWARSYYEEEMNQR